MHHSQSTGPEFRAAAIAKHRAICAGLHPTALIINGIYANLRNEEADGGHPRFAICPGIDSLVLQPQLPSLSPSSGELQSWTPGCHCAGLCLVDLQSDFFKKQAKFK